MLIAPSDSSLGQIEERVLAPLYAAGLDATVLDRCRVAMYVTPGSPLVHGDLRCIDLQKHSRGGQERLTTFSLTEAAARACACCRARALWGRSHLGGWSILRLYGDARSITQRLAHIERVSVRSLSGGMRLELEEIAGLSRSRPGEVFRDAEVRVGAILAGLTLVDDETEFSLWGRRHRLAGVYGEIPPPGSKLTAPGTDRAWKAYGYSQPARLEARGELADAFSTWDLLLDSPSPARSLVAVVPQSGKRPSPSSQRVGRVAADALWRWFGGGVQFRVLPNDGLELLTFLTELANVELHARPCSNPVVAAVAQSVFHSIRDVDLCIHTASAACFEP